VLGAIDDSSEQVIQNLKPWMPAVGWLILG
jgi:hypothetical protein